MSSQNKQVSWLGSQAEMAAAAGCSKRTIGRWIKDGHLRVRRLSARKICCQPADISRCIEKLAKQYAEGK